MRVHAHGRRFGALSLALGFALLVSGCVFVFPQPPAGVPVPNLVLTLSEPEPVAGQFTVTATPENYNPRSVTFQLDHAGSPVFATDDTAPFTATLDTKSLGSGRHKIIATGGDGTYTVQQELTPTFAFRPNIVFLLTDDLDQMTTQYLDAMPHLRSLISDTGMTFSNMFVNNADCCPSRATFLTGRYPHNTGVFDNTPPDGGFQAFAASAEHDTIATRLQAQGYTTSLIGKYFNVYDARRDGVRPGWNDWFGMSGLFMYTGYNYDANDNGVVRSYGATPADYSTDVLANRAATFVNSTETDDARPFFLYLAPTAPHFNIGPPVRYQPNPFADAPLPTRANYDEADVSDKPTWLRDGVPPMGAAGTQTATDNMRNVLGSLLAVDDMVDHLVTQLKQNGEWDHTVFVFGSDNGLNNGAHRLNDKLAPYDESIRVPLIVTGPGIQHGTDDHFVLNNDFAPTMLQLAGAGSQDDMDGRSLLPLLTGTAPPWRSDFLLEFHGTYSFGGPIIDTLADVQQLIATQQRMWVPTFRGIRSDEWLYVEWYSGTVHEYELYDMNADPGQLDNLVATPEGAEQYADVTTALQTRLEQLAVCAGATCRE